MRALDSVAYTKFRSIEAHHGRVRAQHFVGRVRNRQALRLKLLSEMRKVGYDDGPHTGRKCLAVDVHLSTERALAKDALDDLGADVLALSELEERLAE